MDKSFFHIYSQEMPIKIAYTYYRLGKAPDHRLYAAAIMEGKIMKEDILHKILGYIDDNIKQKITIKELADLVGYSPFYFSKLFFETMGISITSYIRIRKLQFALIDLLAGGKVIDVAIAYAFESHEGFTRLFTRLFGSTPRTIRKYLNAYELPSYIVPRRVKREENHISYLQGNLLQN